MWPFQVKFLSMKIPKTIFWLTLFICWFDKRIFTSSLSDFLFDLNIIKLFFYSTLVDLSGIHSWTRIDSWLSLVSRSHRYFSKSSKCLYHQQKVCKKDIYWSLWCRLCKVERAMARDPCGTPHVVIFSWDLLLLVVIRQSVFYYSSSF